MESVAEGERVLFREASEQEWRAGVVKAVRSDGSMDVVDRATRDVVRKVPRQHVKRRPGNDKGTAAGKDAANASWAEGDRVDYATADGEWRRGRIVRRRRDGAAFDVAHESDSDRVDKSVPLKRLRARRSSGAARASDAKEKASEGETEEDAAQQKKKKKTKTKTKATTERAKDKSGRRLGHGDARDEEEEEEEEEEGDADEAAASGSSASGAARRRARSRSTAAATAAGDRLRRGQRVEFSDSKQRVHRGRIFRAREDGACFDIEHDSDSEHVSKRVPAADIRPLKASTRQRTSTARAADPYAVFALNARVYYRLKDDPERKGFVVKVWPREDGDDARFYDVEDEIEGDVVRRVPASRLRPVSWLPSLPAMPTLPALPTLPSLGSWWSSPANLMLRPGAAVRVRLSEEDQERRKADRRSPTSKPRWVDGVLVRLKAKGMCVVRLSGGDEVVVHRRDVRTTLLPSFRPLLPSSLHLQLPTVLSHGLFPVHSAVEVVDPRHEHKVFLGTVLATQDTERTYTIRYDDGRKEKHVAADRVRLSLRRLRIGTEVEMIVEGPCKEVSKLDGEVAWVHRDEKVAVRLLGDGHNDVFAEVSTHALMVDGQPAFSAPLGSTWQELLGVYLNLTLELLAFLWLAFGLLVELSEMFRVLRETAPDRLQDTHAMAALANARRVDPASCAFARNVSTAAGAVVTLAIPEGALDVERTWLSVFLALKLLLLIACAVFSYRLVSSKILALQDNFIDVVEFQQERVLRRHFARVMGGTIVVCYLTLLVLASLLNRLERFCVFRPDTAFRFDSAAMQVDVFSLHAAYATPVDLVYGLSAKSLFNLFRALALFVLIFAFPGGFRQRLLWLAPAIGLTALLSAVGVAALHVFYVVERLEIVFRGALGLTPSVDWALALAFVALWLGASVFRLVAAAGGFWDAQRERQATHRGDVTDELLDQAERGEFGLQAKREALVARVELRQAQLGVCKLSVLRVQRLIVAHVAVLALGIWGSVALRDDVEDPRARSPAASAALTLHLVVSAVWLVLCLAMSALAIGVKRQVPELLTYILDV
ncbi:hypothetical protein P43SY_010035 [Pythium insidiosum]|uniref:Tudor domain-containing protein n=1 Tax=Pythium insidiosum TaxID=114742 RepID=A0AAD5M768_PYTIN|nr:hypothetical protein P43SY_010035 [Pythium insidiosum]